MNKLEAFLFHIAQGGTYESDYDGKCYTRCRYCDCADGQHESDCDSIEAVELIGEERYEQLKQMQVEQDHIDNPAQFSASAASNWSRCECKYCGKNVGALANHLKDNWACIAKRIHSGVIKVHEDDEFDDAPLVWGMDVMLKPIYWDKCNPLRKKIIRLGGKGTAHTSSRDGEFMFKHRYTEGGKRMLLPANYFVRVTDNSSIGVK